MALPDWMIARDVKIEPAAEGIKREGKISYGYTSYGYDARAGYIWRVFKTYPCSMIDPKAFDERMLEKVDLTPTAHQWDEGKTTTGKHKLVTCTKCGKWTHYPDDFPVCNISAPDHILVPPHSFVLGETIEEFTIPRDVLCIVVGKSTYARCGLVVNVTPGEPEWKGKWTIEISNTTPLPAKIYCGEGIMQTIFLRTDGYREMNHKDILNLYREVRGEEPEEAFTKEVMQAATCQTSYADKKGKYQDQKGLTIPTVDKKEGNS